ncbi:neo-calmodulin-like [Tigriopus californicus]|uniref:neo-calmodulin-like n=1 Tax=Tigriopus californicus TaxID=6832 RepID=UPI0027D9F1EC|nr:neo-calmodulin-like [Tigriopus californicus]
MPPITARLRKAPSRLLERVSHWTRRARSASRTRKGSESSGGGTKDEESVSVPDEPLLTEEDHKELLSLLKQNISMDFILEMKEAFQLFDKNGDGYISAKELGVLMRTLGRNPTEDEIMNIMNEIDIDHNGKLDFSEFTMMMRDKLANEDMELEIKQAFRVFDRNGDGYISKIEFKHCMMHFGEQFTDEEVEEMIAEADSNKDGKIDYTEFSQMILKEINMDSQTKS